mmetsp:Transcript_21351/g.35301  ORF Transcript_21351/g.35301 Transcript_21351/m.35301 type:complete len:250 (+) Transcript_21351:2521-3270(+)
MKLVSAGCWANICNSNGSVMLKGSIPGGSSPTSTVTGPGLRPGGTVHRADHTCCASLSSLGNGLDLWVKTYIPFTNMGWFFTPGSFSVVKRKCKRSNSGMAYAGAGPRVPRHDTQMMVPPWRGPYTGVMSLKHMMPLSCFNSKTPLCGPTSSPFIQPFDSSPSNEYGLLDTISEDVDGLFASALLLEDVAGIHDTIAPELAASRNTNSDPLNVPSTRILQRFIGSGNSEMLLSGEEATDDEGGDKARGG